MALKVNNKHLGIFYNDNKGSLIGVYNDSKFKALPWYKRLYGFINKSYKDKFIMLDPIKTKQK